MGSSGRLDAPSVQVLGEAQVPGVVAVLGAAFHDYPVMRYVLGAQGPGYAERLSVLIQFFVRARLFRSEPILGLVDGDEVLAAALVSIPDGRPSPPAVSVSRERTWAELGDDARARYEAFGRACRPFSVPIPHLHLNMIGVRPDQRGRGRSRPLLDRVHALAATTPGIEGVTLTTEDRANLSLYAHFGYEIIGHATVEAELESWGLFRPNVSAPQAAHSSLPRGQ